MNLSRASTVPLLLLGISAASAGETDSVFGAKQLPSEIDLQPGWATSVETQSSIRSQMNAVVAKLRPDENFDLGETVVETVEVTNLDSETGGVRNGNGSEGCLFMEMPGSRIRGWRCYYPNSGEKELNAYQFKEEIEYMRDQQEHLEMLQQEARGMINNYSKMFFER